MIRFFFRIWLRLKIRVRLGVFVEDGGFRWFECVAFAFAFAVAVAAAGAAANAGIGAQSVWCDETVVSGRAVRGG